MKVDWAPLGEVLRFTREPITLEADQEYRRIGIYSWGKGIFRREPEGVAGMGSMRYFTFPIPSLIFSNIQAWEGAVALADELDAGHVCSSRFYPYVALDPDRVNLGYLLEYFRSDHGRDVMRRASSGTQVRNKVLGRVALERSRIPLPSLADQDRIAAHLSAPSLNVGGATPTLNSVLDPGLTAWLETLPKRRLGALVEIGPSPERLGPEDPIDFVPMGAVDASSGEIVAPVRRTRGELTSGYRQFRSGDIIFARITPCMQNGKTAIYRSSADRVAYGSTEFHVLRPSDPRHTEWLWLLLRTNWFISRAVAAFTGTAGQQRVPASFLARVEVPVPPFDELAPSIERLRATRRMTSEIEVARRRRDHLAAAILPAARNEIFSAMR